TKAKPRALALSRKSRYRSGESRLSSNCDGVVIRRAAGKVCLAQAASGRYASQALGMVGLAIWMKTWGFGVRGFWRSLIPTWRRRRSPLRRLQGAQEATMFSQLDSPPLERGTTWSTVRLCECE